MKSSILSLLVGAVTLHAASLPTTATPANHRLQKRAEFPSANGTSFTIDGETKYFAGSNSYWISFLTNNADVELVMRNVASAGLKIFRVWGFNDVASPPGGNQVWYQQLSASGSTINTGANGLQRLDAVVKAAETHGIKLIIPFVNNWDDYGGMNAYVRAFGGSKTTWYTNTQAQAQYRKYIEAVVSRYKTSDAIFAWELANEPRCNGCNTGIIHDWAASTSAYVKSLDPDHMVTLGDEGMGVPGGSSYPYQFTEGTDFVKNLEIETLDFGVFHMYIDQWGVTNDFGPGWIKAHADACIKAGKPCLFEEYGSKTSKCQVATVWQQASIDTEGMAADLFWQWGETLSTGRTHDDGYTVYTGSTEFQCMVADHVKGIAP